MEGSLRYVQCYLEMKIMTYYCRLINTSHCPDYSNVNQMAFTLDEIAPYVQSKEARNGTDSLYAVLGCG